MSEPDRAAPPIRVTIADDSLLPRGTRAGAYEPQGPIRCLSWPGPDIRVLV